MEHLLSQTMKVDNLRGIVKKMSCFLGFVALALFFYNLIGYWSSHMLHLKLVNNPDQSIQEVQSHNASEIVVQKAHHGPKVQSIKSAKKQMKAFEAMQNLTD